MEIHVPVYNINTTLTVIKCYKHKSIFVELHDKLWGEIYRSVTINSRVVILVDVAQERISSSDMCSNMSMEPNSSSSCS